MRRHFVALAAFLVQPQPRGRTDPLYTAAPSLCVR